MCVIPFKSRADILPQSRAVPAHHFAAGSHRNRFPFRTQHVIVGVGVVCRQCVNDITAVSLRQWRFGMAAAGWLLLFFVLAIKRVRFRMGRFVTPRTWCAPSVPAFASPSKVLTFTDLHADTSEWPVTYLGFMLVVVLVCRRHSRNFEFHVFFVFNGQHI